MASSPPSSSHQQDILLLGSSASVVRRCAPSLQLLLQSRFQCEIQVLGLDLDSDSVIQTRSRPRVVPEKRFETTLPSGVRVSVWRADLADFPEAEAVVNAANSRLQHVGGLALALSEAGGARVQQESNDHIRTHGDVKTGDAVALGAGKLKCKNIIHAVGPQLGYRPNAHEVSASKSQLERAMRSVLKIVEMKQLKTVAIPAISSGIFNFPVDQCADAIVSTVQTFYGSSTSTRFKPEEVFLVNNDDPTVKEMERACKKILPSPLSSSHTSGTSPHSSASTLYSQVTSGGGKPQTSASGGYQPSASGGYQTSASGGYKHSASGGYKPSASGGYKPSASGGVHTRGSIKGNAPPEVQLGPVRVLLRRGCLEEQKMDVIVNTIGQERDLKRGQVSKTLLDKAGFKMQQEIYRAPLSRSVLITQGYGLDCKEVYHVCCPFKSTIGSDQMLFRSVQDCLWLVSAKHRSIAFPAIGTGVLGFADREAAQIMINAVWTFAQNSHLPLDVHFVIFPSDGERFKAFEAELNSFRPKAFQMEPPQSSAEAAPGLESNPALPSPHKQASAGWSPEHKSSSVTEPCLRLQSSSRHSLDEAEAWLRCLLYNSFNTVSIRNNFTQLLGERELEELSFTEVEEVQVEEFLDRGRSGMMVRGERPEDIAVTAVKLQVMLQDVQTQFWKEEVEELKFAAQSRVKMERIPVSSSDPELKPFIKQLQKQGLHVMMTERVENPALEKLFKLRKAQMTSLSSDDKLLQLVPAQFCAMVSHIGFRPECAPPNDSGLGEGLYFAADALTALCVWTERSDRFLYVFVAEVLKGRCGRGQGRPGLVLAPGLDSGADPTARYDSVEGSGVTVIFDHRQALPKFIITCWTEADSSSV